MSKFERGMRVFLAMILSAGGMVLSIVSVIASATTQPMPHDIWIFSGALTAIYIAYLLAKELI